MRKKIVLLSKVNNTEKPLTQKQGKLVKLISENVVKKGSTKPLSKMMVEAGYSKSTAKSRSKEIIEPIRESGAFDFLVDTLDSAIEKLSKEVNNATKIKKLNTYTAALTLDIAIKNRQLLTGKNTGMIGVDLSNEQIKKINDRLTKRLGK